MGWLTFQVFAAKFNVLVMHASEGDKSTVKQYFSIKNILGFGRQKFSRNKESAIVEIDEENQSGNIFKDDGGTRSVQNALNDLDSSHFLDR